MNAEELPGLPQASKMESQATIVNCFWPSTIVAKQSISDVCGISDSTSKMSTSIIQNIQIFKHHGFFKKKKLISR